MWFLFAYTVNKFVAHCVPCGDGGRTVRRAGTCAGSRAAGEIDGFAHVFKVSVAGREGEHSYMSQAESVRFSSVFLRGCIFSMCR